MVTVEALIAVSGDHVGGEGFPVTQQWSPVAVTTVAMVSVVMVTISLLTVPMVTVPMVTVPMVTVPIPRVVLGPPAGVQRSVAVQYRLEEGVGGCGST